MTKPTFSVIPPLVRGTMTRKPELVAMAKIGNILDKLDDITRATVIRLLMLIYAPTRQEGNGE